jgi:hypothetical protein
MPRGGAFTFGDLDGKLEVLRVSCTKCDRAGQYHVAKLTERYGRNGSLSVWRHEISKDCPKLANDRVALMDICGAYFPDLADRLSRTSLS